MTAPTQRGGECMYVAGVDVGSTQTKAVLMRDGEEIVGRCLTDTGSYLNQVADEAFHAAAVDAKVPTEEVVFVVGTGYGRYRITFGNTQVTEISCHARGAQHLFPNTQTVLDIGGQDTKAIRVGTDGQVVDFTMNDKCSAGTGRYLGAAAFALDMGLGELGPAAMKATNPVKMTTTCTVFAESEIINWVARGRKIEDVLMGVHKAIVMRSISLLMRVGISPELTFTGGVTRNVAVVHALEEQLGMPINVSTESHYMGAIGAALYAYDLARGGSMPLSLAAPGKGAKSA